MKSKSLRAFAVLFAAAGATGCWYLLQREPPNWSSSLIPRIPVTQQTPTKIQAAEAWPHRGTPEFNRIALERGKKWLASRGRDAGSLVAMWDVSGEKALLKEASERFPDDPRVCLAMIQQAGKDSAKAIPWIERLIAAEPGNPEGYYLKAAALMNANDRAGALAALRTAATMNGPRDNHLRERIMTVREGALASGAGTGDAAWLALAAALETSTIYTPISAMGPALKQEIADAKAAGNEERMLEIAGLGLGLAARFNDTYTGLIVDSLVASSLERMILNQLSDDTEIGTDGKTAGQMKQEAAARGEQLADYLKHNGRSNALLESSPDAVVAEFADRFLLHGEMEAGIWLTQHAAEKSKQ